jgi:cytochrome c biogenesis protein CcdA
MWQALGQLLPIAIAAAVSSVPIMATILILLSDERDKAALPFLAGWVIGAATILTLATLLAQSAPQDRPRHDETWVGILEIVIGAALIAVGLVAMRRPRTQGAAVRTPAWMGRIGSIRGRRAFWLGLALNVRPKALLLIAAAGLLLRSASLSIEGTALVMAFFIVVATSTVVFPILFTLVAPDRMGPRLVATRDWISSNGPIVTGAVMVLVGLFLVYAGFTQV